MHSGKPLSFKATAPRVATAVVATPRFGCRRLQRPCSTEIYGRRSQSSSPKMPSISPRELQRSILSTITYIPRATKDDDDAVALAAELYLADVWPDFSKKKVDPAVRIEFFNRKREYDMIVDHLKEEPTVSLLLLGPKNSGKSELIKILKEQEGPRMLHIDLGMHDTSSPALMAQQLHKQARKLPAIVGKQFFMVLASQLGPLSNLYKTFYPEKTPIVDAAPSMEEIVEALMADVLPPYTATDLTAVIDAYNMILDNIPPGQTKPVIVIDEANALTLWKRKDEVALKQLLEFFKRSCKQYHSAHVILASSEFFMISWLESQGFDENWRDDQVLGDLTSAEAFVYFCGGKVLNRNGVVEAWPGLIAQSKETLALGMTPEDWKKVWSVCGGNIQLLKICVTYAKQSKSWKEGVARVLLKPSMAVTKALEYPEVIDPPVGSGGPRLWEAKHYKAVLRLIDSSPYYAVRRKEVHAALKDVGDIPENVTAAQVLLSMVKFNVLSLRPYTEMAKDIPREAFFKKVGRKEKQDNVVTMPSPAHLAAVLELDVELEEEQDELESVEAVEDNSQANS